MFMRYCQSKSYNSNYYYVRHGKIGKYCATNTPVIDADAIRFIALKFPCANYSCCVGHFFTAIIALGMHCCTSRLVSLFLARRRVTPAVCEQCSSARRQCTDRRHK